MSSKGGQGPGTPPSGEERLQVYLTIFTINNVVRELNLRSVEVFLGSRTSFRRTAQVDEKSLSHVKVP